MRWCARCVLPDTRPNLELDAEGVCNACRSHEQREEVDWQRRAEEFAAIVERAPPNHYALFCLGRSLQQLGRHAEARAPLALAASLRPDRRDYRLYRDRARAAA